MFALIGIIDVSVVLNLGITLVAGRAVIAFALVFDNQLPVCIEVVGFAIGEPGLFEAVRLDQPAQIIRRRELRRRLREADEDEPGDIANLSLLQTEGVFREIIRHPGIAQQATIKIIRPSMIGTYQHIGLPGRLFTDDRAAMAADVEQGSYPVVAAADDDEGVCADLVANIFARFPDLAGMPRVVVARRRRF